MAITLQNLRDAIRVEIRDPDGIQFEDDRLDFNINQAYRTTFLQIANQLQNQFETAELQDLVIDQEEYPEPANSLRVRGVELVQSGVRTPLTRYRGGSMTSTSASSTFAVFTPAPTYDIRGSNILLRPPSKVGITDGLNIIFQEGPVDLVDGGNETVHADFKDAWKDPVVIRAAWACLSQIETLGGLVSIVDFRERKKDIEDAFLTSIGLRTLSPERRRRRGYFC